MSASLVLLLWFFFIAPSGLSKFFRLDIFWDDTLMFCNKHSFSWALTVIVFLIFFKKELWNTDLQQFQVLASCFVLLVLFLMTLYTRFYFCLVLVLRFIDLKRFDKNNQVVIVSMCAFLFSFCFFYFVRSAVIEISEYKWALLLFFRSGFFSFHLLVSLSFSSWCFLRWYINIMW